MSLKFEALYNLGNVLTRKSIENLYLNFKNIFLKCDEVNKMKVWSS
jgi:hypothetical protein